MPLTRLHMAAAVARDIPEGWYVNLGSGIPESVAEFVPASRGVVFHRENGVLGVVPEADAIDRWLINAGKPNVMLLDGGAYGHHDDSFTMIRGGHLDLCVLSAFEVAENGDIANWATSEAVGGAMDFALGARRLWAVMEHTTKEGRPRLVRNCGYPLTAPTAVSRVYTNLAVLDVMDQGFVVRELAPGVDFETVQARTDAKLIYVPAGVVSQPMVAPGSESVVRR